MRRYPRTQRAIAAELKHARVEAGYASARSLSLAMGEAHNYIWLLEKVHADPSGAQIYAVCQKLKLRPSTFWARVERRLKG
jgi:hypothetical protein